MDRELYRQITKNGIPRRTDAVWQYCIVAGIVALYAEFDLCQEGTVVYCLISYSSFLFLFSAQHGSLRWLVGRRLEIARSELTTLRTRSGENSDAMWNAISYVAKPDWMACMFQFLALFFAISLYRDYGIFDYSDVLGDYDWLIWLFLAWMSVQLFMRSKLIEKVEGVYYRHMYLANTSH